MCESCEKQADSMSEVVDTLLAHERATHKLHAGNGKGWNTVRLANTIIDCHGENGFMSHDDVRAITIEYAIVVQRLLALEEMTGMSPP